MQKRYGREVVIVRAVEFEALTAAWKARVEHREVPR